MDNLRRAIVFFTAVMLVVAAATGFALSLNFHSTSSASATEIDYTGSKYSPSETTAPVDDSVITVGNILFIVGDSETKSSEVMAIVNFDGADKDISVLYIPRDTRYTYAEGASATVTQCGIIGDCYSINGGSLTSQIVSALTGITINRYVYMDFDQFSLFVNHFSSRESGVLFNMPIKIAKITEFGRVSVNQGSQYFDGAKAASLFMYSGTDEESFTADVIDYFDGSEDGRVRIVSMFVSAFISQKFISPSTDYYVTNFVSLMTSALNGVDTDITTDDINAYSRGANTYNSTQSYKIVCEKKALQGNYYTNRIMDADISYNSDGYSESTSKEMLSEHFNTVS